MARTKQEIRNWLDSQVGKKVKDKSNSDFDGQCVALIKALLEYVGAPDPYKARGNAKDAGDSYVREGIAEAKDGWLRVVVNRDMGRIGGKTYGHIWVDLANEANYEQNGAKALLTTKGTRPYSQKQQVVNLDKYIKADPAPAKKSNEAIADEVIAGKWGNGEDRKNNLKNAGYDPATIQGIVNAKLSPARKSNETIANEVLAGQWGNGDDRKARLANAGYDYGAIQAIVNSRADSGVYYTVKAGDNLTQIAARYNTTWQAIARLNGIPNANIIYAGQRLRIK